ncbi:MAG TPA: GNAT family N-acetyltransferase [Candidatus Faecousia intestinigallinarum]|nr:GNAT family N-acetyltransferase [Candidatus Faecousia intestinigallinarum]
MITLRDFTDNDAETLKIHQYSQLSVEEISKMIGEWNQKQIDGRYFEMFALVDENIVVGSISLYQHTKHIVGCGPDIFSPYRRQGFAYCGMTLVLEYAKQRGYKVAVAQVRKNNLASIALHQKLNFELDHDYINTKGYEVYFYIKSLT